MKLNENLFERIQELIESADFLSRGSPTNDHITPLNNMVKCEAWLGASFNAICMACENPNHAYRQACERALNQWPDAHQSHFRVGAVAGLLGHLLADAKRGLLVSVAENASAETFDDLLDHAEEYMRQERKEGSGILATAVFEDTLRRIARSNEIETDGVKLDVVISRLKREGVITKIVDKRCRTAAGVRNEALHANWDAFTLGDVEDVIKLTRHILEEHLAA